MKGAAQRNVWTLLAVRFRSTYLIGVPMEDAGRIPDNRLETPLL
jgi:hypothetical protein